MNQNIHEAQRLIKPEERPDEIVVTELKRATDWADCQCHGKGLIPNVDKYASLENVLHRALEQARSGKGAERHATGQSFDQQPMLGISHMIGSHHGLLYQAIKKAQESTRLPTVERQVAELLGAVNYLAGAIIYLESPKCT